MLVVDGDGWSVGSLCDVNALGVLVYKGADEGNSVEEISVGKALGSDVESDGEVLGY